MDRLENDLSAPGETTRRRPRRGALDLPLEAPAPGPLLRVAAATLLLGTLAVALVPDEAILRPKLVWSRGLTLAAACLALVAQGRRGALTVPGAYWLAAALVPGLLALLHPIHTDVASDALARDEILRLLLIPVTGWTAAVCLAHRAWRRGLLTVLGVGGLVVGGRALLEGQGALYSAVSQLALALEIVPTERPSAGFGNPVFLGAWLVLVTPLLLADALTNRGPSRWLSAAATGLLLPALGSTQSVGSWFGFGLALLAGLWLLLPSNRHRMAMLGAVLVTGAFVVVSRFDALMRDREHGLIWRDSWELFTLNPGGVGPGQFQIAFLPFASDELLAKQPLGEVIINDAHSEPLQLLVELGWPALLAVGVALVYGLAHVRTMLAAHWTDGRDRALFVAAVAGAVGCVGQSFVSPDLRFHVTSLTLGLVVGLAFAMGPTLTVALKAPARVLVALAGLGVLGYTGHATWEKMRFAAEVRPPPPADLSEGAAEEIAALQTRAEEQPDSALAWYELGSRLAEARRFPESANAFRRSLTLDPGNVGVSRSLGIVATFAGQYDEAVRHLRISLANRPEDPDVRYLLALASFGRGDLLTAVSEAESILADDPEHLRARILLERLRE